MSLQRGTIVAAVVFAVSLVVAGVATWRVDDVAGLLRSGPATDWQAGVPSKDLAVLPAAASAAPVPDAAQVAAKLQPLLADSALGTNVTAHVMDVATGQVLFGKGSDAPTIPASTIKLVTAVSALSALGPDHQFVTKAVAGAAAGEVVLVGGGDMTLSAAATGTYPEAATLPDLAEQVKKSLGGTAPTKVTFDISIFQGSAVGPWDADIPQSARVVGPIVGLTTDGARVDPKVGPRGSTPRVANPAATAGQAFAKLLGVPTSAVALGTAPQGAKELGAVKSMSLSRMVELMLVESDNMIAEALARHVAIKKGKPATFEGGAEAQMAQMTELGFAQAELALADGSGLSRGDKVTPSLLAEVVALSAKPDKANLRAVLSGVPVAAYNGTLSNRFKKSNAGASAAGMVRVKTGTLRSVSAVAGIVFTADGRELAVAILADGVASGDGPTLSAQDALDRVLAAIASCGCRA
jgi:D-alanyl-D-alanine carboxypeptidase/D-alanyl-D-alanine-endopeptidase (penicillin-binding protein 4)